MDINTLFGNVTRMPTGGFIEGSQDAARTFGGGSLGDEAAVMMISDAGAGYDGPGAAAGWGAAPSTLLLKLKAQPWWVWVMLAGGTFVVGGAVLKHFAKK